MLQFALPGWWLADYMSLQSGQPSGYYIQAVEPTAVAVIGRHDLDELYAAIPSLERYFRIIMQKAYAASTRRIEYLFCQSGEERYRMFRDTYPEFVQRVPQYMLASFLGITPEFLSKIRGKKQG